jgi:hypothetical protein
VLCSERLLFSLQHPFVHLRLRQLSQIAAKKTKEVEEDAAVAKRHHTKAQIAAKKAKEAAEDAVDA